MLKFSSTRVAFPIATLVPAVALGGQAITLVTPPLVLVQTVDPLAFTTTLCTKAVDMGFGA